MTKNNWQKTKILGSLPFQSRAHDTVNELVFVGRERKTILLEDGTRLLEFVSCSYLGLDQDLRLAAAACGNLGNYGTTFSAARTRVKAKSFDILDEKLGKMLCGGYPTVFHSLHLGHLGLIPMLGSGQMPSFPAKTGGFDFLLDKRAHSSIQINRGTLEQFGEVTRVDVSKIDALRERCREAYQQEKTPVVFCDSVGSMGALAPICEILELLETYNGYAYFDDAHGTSIFGRYGAGYVLEQLNYKFHPRIILASSLAKAFGVVAGVVALPTKEDLEFFRTFCPTYVFGGPPALSAIDSAIVSAEIHLSDEIYALQEKLSENLSRFDGGIVLDMRKHIVNFGTASPIRGLLIGDENKAIDAALWLREQGIAVTTAMYPTVEKGKSILRMAICANHTKAEIKKLCDAICEVKNRLLKLEENVVINDSYLHFKV